jgi:hypothetical protein
MVHAATATPDTSEKTAPMNTTEAPLPEASTEEISNNIERFGVQLIAVPQDPDDDFRSYVYTIGFRTRGMPELIAFADDHEQLDALAEVLSRLALRERPLAAGERVRIAGETLVAAVPDAELDALLQEQCLLEARAYYGVPHLDLLVIARERELSDPVSVH